MSTVNQRRHERYDIKIPATLVAINSPGFVHCVIHDFCMGGLFLVPQKDINITHIKIRQKIQVLFSVDTKQGNKDFKQDAKIMNMHSKGIGVAFENDSSATYSALKNEAQNKFGSVHSVSNSKSPGSLKQKNIEIELVTFLDEILPKIIIDFYQRTLIKLSEEVEIVKNIEKNVILENALTLLNQKRAILFESFCKDTHELSQLTLSAPIHQEQEEKESGLSLVDKNDFEDWLDLSFFIRNLEMHFKSQLGQIEKKLVFLTGIDKNKISNPTSPATLFIHFRDAISSIGENKHAKHSFYTSFEETLFHLLPDIYKKLDNVLVEQGAPEKIINTPSSWLKISPGKVINDTNEINNSNNNEITSNKLGASFSDTNTFINPNSENPEQQTKSLVDVATNLLRLLQKQTPAQQSLPAINTSFSNYSGQEISNALAQLQLNTVKKNSFQNTSNAIQPDLIDVLKNSTGSDKQLSEVDKNNLQVYEKLFEILFNELLTGNEVKSYLQRIRLPIMNMAMKDSGFMDSENHPARKIVNYLSQLEPAIEENRIVKNEHIKHKVDQLMEQISAESLENNEIFDSVEKQLYEITTIVNKSIDRNIKRITDVYDGKEKLEKARNFIQNEINHRLAEKKTPKIILSLLEAGWQHLLVFAKLNDDNNGLQGYLRIITNLNGWLLGSERASKEQVNTSLEFIDKHLQTVCTNTFLHNKILAKLKELLSSRGSLTDSADIELATIKAPVKDKIASHIKKLDQLKVGDWLTFLLKEKQEPLELIWIGGNQELYVFVNRSGIKKIELKGKELAEKINSGAAKIIENMELPVMDRATNTMLQNMHEQLITTAIHDSVTLLLNRKEFVKQLKQELLFFDDIHHLLCNIEIQDFRLIATSCGSAGGDALLKQMAEMLTSLIDKEDILARLDNNTFSLLLKNHVAEDAITELKKLQTELISKPFDCQDKSFAIAVGIGVFPLLPESDHDLNSIMQKTDIATLAAITAGRNHIQIYESTHDDTIKSQYNLNEWAGRINQVFSENRLFLRCQKIVSIDSDKSAISHYEILLGIYDENNNVISPDNFIPAVEHCQRMTEVDRWVVLSVFEWIEQNEFDFDMLDGFSINLSGESLNSDDFLSFLTKTLSSSHIALEKITFEITETVAASNVEFVKKFIKQIKQFNCKFSLDDFGSGYSSYSYLKSLDVDYLKIDGAFVKDMVDNNADIAIVTSMNDIAHALGLETVAEFVENEKTLEQLKEIGVDFAQGWGIEKSILLSELI